MICVVPLTERFQIISCSAVKIKMNYNIIILLKYYYTLVHHLVLYEIIFMMQLLLLNGAATTGADAGARCCSLEYVSVAVGADDLLHTCHNTKLQHQPCDCTCRWLGSKRKDAMLNGVASSFKLSRVVILQKLPENNDQKIIKKKKCTQKNFFEKTQT